MEDSFIKWLLVGVVVGVVSIFGYGVYLLKTTRCAAYEFQMVLVPVDDGVVLTPMSTGLCARRVPK